MLSGNDAFSFSNRHGKDTMSVRTYIGVLTVYVCGGLALAALTASVTYTLQPTWLWIVLFFTITIPGILISAKSDNWVISTIGYLMVILPSGAIIGPYVSIYTMDSVLQCVLITLGATLALGTCGVLYPKSVESWGGILLFALLILIFGDIARVFMIGYLDIQPVSLGLWDWVGVGLFSIFIFYDMNRAVRLPRTMDNAVDSAVALYLDIINLFLKLLSATGDRKE